MKYAVCNELFGDLPLADSCRQTAAYGFTGIELAPYTFCEDPHELGPTACADIKHTSLEIFNQADPPERILQETRRVIQHIEWELREE